MKEAHGNKQGTMKKKDDDTNAYQNENKKELRQAQKRSKKRKQ